MISTNSHNGITWTDIESPTPEEIERVIEKHGIHPSTAEELLLPSFRAKVELYDRYIYLILHFPSLTEEAGGPLQEIDFVIGRDFIITTRYGTMDPLHEFSKVFEVNSTLDRDDMGDHAGYLFFYMIKYLYRKTNDELQYIEEILEEIEENIFEGHEQDMVHALSVISRELLHFKQATALHKNVFESFESAGAKFFGIEFEYPLRAIVEESQKIQTLIASQIDTLNELRSTNDSLLTTKQNETMKHLTMMAFVTFPLSLFAAIFSMDTKYNPIVGNPNDFWIIVGIMFFTAFGFFLFFKYKKWL